MKITRVISDETGVCMACKDDVMCSINITFLNLFPDFSIVAELCDGHLDELKKHIRDD